MLLIHSEYTINLEIKWNVINSPVYLQAKLQEYNKGKLSDYNRWYPFFQVEIWFFIVKMDRCALKIVNKWPYNDHWL